MYIYLSICCFANQYEPSHIIYSKVCRATRARVVSTIVCENILSLSLSF